MEEDVKRAIEYISFCGDIYTEHLALLYLRHKYCQRCSINKKLKQD